MSKNPVPIPSDQPTATAPATGDYDARAARGLTWIATGGTIAYAAVMGNFLTLFANGLGFGPMLIGLLGLAVQAPVALQLFMARYVDRHGGKHIAQQTFVVGALALLPLIFAPQLSRWLGPTAAVVAVFASVLGYAASSVPVGTAWFPILRANLPDDRIAEIMGRMNRVIMSCALVATVVFGLFLGTEAPVWRYQVIFAVGALMNGLRGIGFRRVKEMKTTPELKAGPFWRDLWAMLSDARYRQVLVFSLICWTGVGVSLLFRPLWITSLGFSARFAALLTVPLVLGAYGAAAQAWGALADRYGSRAVYVLACIGVVAGHLLLALPTDNSAYSGVLLAVGLALAAGAWGGFDSANQRRLFTIVPQHGQALFLAVYSITIFLCLSVGSMLGGMVVKTMRALAPEAAGTAGFAHALDYRVLFLLSAAMIVLAAGYSRRMMPMKEIGAGRLLLYFRIRTQRFIMNGVAGDLFRWAFPQPERDTEEREDHT